MSQPEQRNFTNSIMGSEIELDMPSQSVRQRMMGSFRKIVNAARINRFVRRNKDLILSDKNLKYIIDLFCKWGKYTKSEEEIKYCEDVFSYIVERLYWSNFNESQYVSRLMMFFFK